MSLPSGTLLGPYEIVGLLGAGGMGEVYRARDARLGRDVAVKVLPVEFASDPERLRRFGQEARAVAALNHPNILAIHDVGSARPLLRADDRETPEAEGAGEPVHYIVTELVEGKSLRQLLDAGAMPVRQAVQLAAEIASGLAAAHGQGIIHRDLKPENVIVGRQNHVKILDFGLAKLAAPSGPGATTVVDATQAGSVLGTAGYMSPEQVRGLDVDARSDIFSFGCVLSEMLSGHPPFRRQTAADTFSAILNEDPKPIGPTRAGIPPELDKLVARCLRKDPDRRAQNMADVRLALLELGEEPDAKEAPPPSPPRRRVWMPAAVAVVVVGLAAGALLWLRGPKRAAGGSAWVQVTDLPDSVSQPALSRDGRMLTFIRGPSTFVGPGEVYVKMLPDGEPVQLTHDNVPKMSPVFSPDGTEIAYTTVGMGTYWDWDTWVVPVINGQPHAWLPNASGLVWPEKGKILFSEIKDHDIHMAIVAAEESRAGARDVYVPASDRGMAHRSYPSPDGKWVLVVEMDRAQWLPCRLVPMDGGSPGRQVGPPNGGCTSAAWSPDGRFMYLNSSAGGVFHIWRQPFPNGRPEQVTSGPTEEEGIALAPDGRSLITAVGRRQSSVWLHDSAGERRVSLEGYSFDPKFTPDGRKLCYRILKGALPISDPSELRVVDLESGRNEAVLPGFAVTGMPSAGYDISADSRQVVVTALDRDGKYRLWVVPLDRRTPPREVPNVEGQQPVFGPDGEIFFRVFQGLSAFVYRVRPDGTGLRKVIEQPIAGVIGVSPGGHWLAVKLPGPEGSTIAAIPLGGGPLTPFLTSFGGESRLKWSRDGKWIFVLLPTSAMLTSGRTVALPLPPGRELPQVPPGGFRSGNEIAKLPGARVVNTFDMAPGATIETYAFALQTVQRNLYRIPTP